MIGKVDASFFFATLFARTEGAHPMEGFWPTLWGLASCGEFKGEAEMAQQNSPVTGIINEAEVILDFGKYEGRTVKDILDADPMFYDQLAQEKERGCYAIRRNKDKTFRLYMNPLSEIDQ